MATRVDESKDNCLCLLAGGAWDPPLSPALTKHRVRKLSAHVEAVEPHIDPLCIRNRTNAPKE